MSESWLAEQWLISAGIVPESSVDTLLMYAYAHKSVAHVTLEINQDEENKGQLPTVSYKLKLHPIERMKWEAVQKAKAIKGTILQKAALLVLSRAGATLDLEQQIEKNASEYLPPKYKVTVQVIE